MYGGNDLEEEIFYVYLVCKIFFFTLLHIKKIEKISFVVIFYAHFQSHKKNENLLPHC